MLTSVALVLMMTIPGLGLIYAGMVRKKNVGDHGVRLCTGGPVDSVDSRVRAQTYGLKKNCTAFSAVRALLVLVGAPARGSNYVSFVAQPAFIGPPHLVFDPQGAAGILPKPDGERKRREAFPQSRSVGQTKQSHLTVHGLAKARQAQ